MSFEPTKKNQKKPRFLKKKPQPEEKVMQKQFSSTLRKLSNHLDPNFQVTFALITFQISYFYWKLTFFLHTEIQAADIVPENLDEHDEQMAGHEMFRNEGDHTQEAIEAAIAMENFEMAGNIETLMKKQLNLDKSKDILDRILKSL